MNLNSIGITIKELRTKAKLSQDELANKLFVSRQAISNWECGKTYPDIDNIRKISGIFNVSIESIITGTNKGNNASELLYSETIKTKKKNKKMFKTIILLIFLITILIIIGIIGYFFIDNYSKTKIYRIDSKNNLIQEGLFVVTNDTWYLKFGPFNNKKDIKRIKVYLKINGKEELICVGLGENTTLSEKIGYNELFRFSEKETINNMYLDFTYTDDEIETIKANFTLEYENSKIFREKQESISEGNRIEVDPEEELLHMKMLSAFKTTNNLDYKYNFKYKNENYTATFYRNPKYIDIWNEEKSYRIHTVTPAYNTLNYWELGLKNKCYVKLRNIKVQGGKECSKDLQIKLKGIYDTFINLIKYS